jgi:hypothetical protein
VVRRIRAQQFPRSNDVLPQHDDFARICQTSAFLADAEVEEVAE